MSDLNSHSRREAAATLPFEELEHEALRNHYYRVLGLSTGASHEEVNTRCKHLISLWHPDLHLNKPENIPLAQSKYLQLKEAYSYLQRTAATTGPTREEQEFPDLLERNPPHDDISESESDTPIPARAQLPLDLHVTRTEPARKPLSKVAGMTALAVTIGFITAMIVGFILNNPHSKGDTWVEYEKSNGYSKSYKNISKTGSTVKVKTKIAYRTMEVARHEKKYFLCEKYGIKPCTVSSIIEAVTSSDKNYPESVLKIAETGNLNEYLPGLAYSLIDMQLDCPSKLRHLKSVSAYDSNDGVLDRIAYENHSSDIDPESELYKKTCN